MPAPQEAQHCCDPRLSCTHLIVLGTVPGVFGMFSKARDEVYNEGQGNATLAIELAHKQLSVFKSPAVMVRSIVIIIFIYYGYNHNHI